MRSWILSALFALIAEHGFAQSSPPPNVRPPEATGVDPGLLGFFTGRTPYEFWLTLVIVVFGFLVILSILRFFRGTSDSNGDRVVRALVVVVIVVGTLVLITAGYNNEQVAPAFGLFGTIVGYFLGRLSSTAEHAAATTPASAAPTDAAAPKPSATGSGT